MMMLRRSVRFLCLYKHASAINAQIYKNGHVKNNDDEERIASHCVLAFFCDCKIKSVLATFFVEIKSKNTKIFVKTTIRYLFPKIEWFKIIFSCCHQFLLFSIPGPRCCVYGFYLFFRYIRSYVYSLFFSVFRVVFFLP